MYDWRPAPQARALRSRHECRRTYVQMVWLMRAINKREIAQGIRRRLLVRHVLLRVSNPLREGGRARDRTRRAEAALVEQCGRRVLFIQIKKKLLRANLTVTRWRPNPFVITRSSKKGRFGILGRYRLSEKPSQSNETPRMREHSFSFFRAPGGARCNFMTLKC